MTTKAAVIMSECCKTHDGPHVHGCILPMSGFDGGGYGITEFGRALLGALRRSRA